MKKDLRASRSRTLATVAVAVITAIMAACSDAASPSAPSASRDVSPQIEEAVAKASVRAASLPQSFIAQGLLRERPLQRALSITKVIRSSGGSIDLPGTDFELRIPRGAFVGSSMTFTITALPGAAVAYDFEPRGAHFLVPLTFVQKLGHTNLHGVKLPAGFQSEISGAYFTDASMIDPETGIAVVAEVMPADVSGTWSGDQLSFPIWHFSGYMASTGRR